MSLTVPYLRQIEVLIGPLSETEGGGDEKEALLYYGDGTLDNLRIRFSMTREIYPVVQPTIVSIYNLSPETRNNFFKITKNNKGLVTSQDYKQIIVRAGWVTTGMAQVFQGSLMACVNRREGADIITDFYAIQGGAATGTAYGKLPYSAGGSVAELVYAAAQDFRGVKVFKSNIRLDGLYFGSQGYTDQGMTTTLLTALGKQYGFTWWIDMGTFYATKDKEYMGFSGEALSSEIGNLIRIEPALVAPQQQVLGAHISCLFNPNLKPGWSVYVESKINKGMNGYFKMKSIHHSCDTHSSNWTTDIDTFQDYLEGTATPTSYYGEPR